MPKYSNAPDIKKVAVKLVQKYPTKFADVFPDRIIFLWDESLKEKKKIAYVRKIDELSKFRDPEHDFFMVVSRFMVKDFTPGQLHTLVVHEMCHIGPRDEDKDGNDTVKIVNHDFEEFFSVIVPFGADWTFNKDCKDPLEEDIKFAYLPVETKSEKKKDKKDDLKIAARSKGKKQKE